MRSLVEEALAKDTAPVRAEPAPNFGYQQLDSTDAELIELLQRLKTNIKIVGCGGGGSNTINRIFEENISGVETYAANTDAQHLLTTRAHHKILLGRRSTRGLGAGALPQVGEQAAREAEEEIRKSVV